MHSVFVSSREDGMVTHRGALHAMVGMTLAALLCGACAGAPTTAMPSPPAATPAPAVTPVSPAPQTLRYEELVHLYDYDSQAPLDVVETGVRNEGDVTIQRITYSSPRGGNVQATDADELYRAASSPKDLKWYDADHNLNEQARADRDRWLQRQLGNP
jgi:hypothetical protein